nr:MAG TPA: hypothetical protein [Caudoviricetes sp.]
MLKFVEKKLNFFDFLLTYVIMRSIIIMSKDNNIFYSSF